uniref:Uncharacterized protein n=1 Tax=Daucus carota subsp. sativus TaxID=79200 RepID=A0A164ZMI8_DAUCS
MACDSRAAEMVAAMAGSDPPVSPLFTDLSLTRTPVGARGNLTRILAGQHRMACDSQATEMVAAMAESDPPVSPLFTDLSLTP